MSQSLLENPIVVPRREPTVFTAVQAGPSGSKPRMSPWKWAAITCLFLLISGAIRTSRDMQFYGIARQSTNCPFPLKDLPLVLGPWTAVPNSETQLDPEIARLAGSSDHLIRSYSNPANGEVASVLVLYGLADSVFGHSPEVCIKAAGYQAVTPPVDRVYSVEESTAPVRFRGFYISRRGVGMTEYSEVVWSFWHAGSWMPEVASRWKYFRNAPAMFKIQIQRPATGISTEEFSCESLLKEIVRDLDTRIAQAKGAASDAPKHAVTSR